MFYPKLDLQKVCGTCGLWEKKKSMDFKKYFCTKINLDFHYILHEVFKGLLISLNNGQFYVLHIFKTESTGQGKGTSLSAVPTRLAYSVCPTL